MARAIDADELRNQIRHMPRTVNPDLVQYALVQAIIADMPTLTPPNETPPCYQPDGDGCAYQCYDGQDEPIDKCKECPLCYSDKQRHHAPPNEPLPVLVNDETGREYIDYICPRCKDIISQRRRGQRMETVYQCKYHDNCGQRVDWSNPQPYRRPPEGDV